MTAGLDLKDIEAFVAVADERSFTAAARRLGVNQSVISTRVAHLEEQLQTRLFDRGARSSTPTPAGSAVLGRARSLVADALELVQQARRLGDVAEGTLAIAASTVPGTFYLPRVLAELRRHAPRLTVDMRLSDSDAALTALRRGEVELAMIGRELEDEDLETATIWSDAVVLVASKRVAAQLRPRSTLVDLPLVLRRTGSATRRTVVDALQQRGVSTAELQVTLIAPDNEVAREAALADLGAAFLSERAAHRELGAGQLVRLDRLFAPVHRPLVLAALARRTLSAGGRMLADLLRAEHA